MLAAQEKRKEIKSRIWNPVNGNHSSELDIVTEPELRRRRIALLRPRARYPQIASQEARQERERAFNEIFAARFAPLTMLGISKMVCRYYDIPRESLAAARRTVLLVRPRQIIMFLAKEHTKLSLPQIGAQLAGMDHTTVLHGIRRIKQLMQTDIRLAAEVENFERDLGYYRAGAAVA